MSASLSTWSRSQISLQDAISAYSELVDGEKAIALLFSPRRCQFATLVDHRCSDEAGNPIHMEDVFEARVFNDTAEMRWLNGTSGAHRGVILTETQPSKPPHGWDREAIPAIATLTQTYQLWGEGTGKFVSDGWSELATARIGSLNVPVAGIITNQRVFLETREYVIEAEHGNAVIQEERLIRLGVK